MQEYNSQKISQRKEFQSGASVKLQGTKQPHRKDGAALYERLNNNILKIKHTHKDILVIH